MTTTTTVALHTVTLDGVRVTLELTRRPEATTVRVEALDSQASRAGTVEFPLTADEWIVVTSPHYSVVPAALAPRVNSLGKLCGHTPNTRVLAAINCGVDDASFLEGVGEQLGKVLDFDGAQLRYFVVPHSTSGGAAWTRRASTRDRLVPASERQRGTSLYRGFPSKLEVEAYFLGYKLPLPDECP